MKRVLFAAALATGFVTWTDLAHAEIGVSVNIGQPGFYGRLDIGNYPPPLLVYPQPLIIERVRPDVTYAPIYLRVPPGHARKWGKHCYRYSACGRPVYFVQDSWYNDVYVPRYSERHGNFHHRHEERRRIDRYGPGERGYGPGYPPGHRPGLHRRDNADFPPGPRPGHGWGYGPGPGFGPGRLPGPP